jgi:hypothetical protein
MLWAAAVLAGAPLWLSLGILPVALWNRRQAMRSPGAFGCKVRVIGPLLADGPRPPTRYHRLSAWSVLTHPRRLRRSGHANRLRRSGHAGRFWRSGHAGRLWRSGHAGRLWRSGHAGRPRARFPLLGSTAWWVSDVLAVQGGLGVSRTRLLPVAAGDSIRPLDGRGVRGLGDAPRSVLLILADGQLVEVAVAGSDVRLLAGPLVARVPAHRN